MLHTAALGCACRNPWIGGTLQKVWPMVRRSGVNNQVILVVAIILSTCAGCNAAVSGNTKPLFARQAEEIYSGQCLKLALAAADGRLAQLDLLLRDRSLVDCQGANDATPLYWAIAARKTNLAGLEKLLAAGADPNHYLESDKGLIHVAVMRGDASIVKALLNHGANPNLPDKRSDRTPLFYVGPNGYDVVVALLEARADVNHRDVMGLTPMMALAVANQFKAVALLLDAGADERATSKSGDSLSKIVQRISQTWDESSDEYQYFLKVQRRLNAMDPSAWQTCASPLQLGLPSQA
jgi:hypothetical protein